MDSGQCDISGTSQSKGRDGADRDRNQFVASPTKDKFQEWSGVEIQAMQGNVQKVPVCFWRVRCGHPFLREQHEKAPLCWQVSVPRVWLLAVGTQ